MVLRKLSTAVYSGKCAFLHCILKRFSTAVLLPTSEFKFSHFKSSQLEKFRFRKPVY